MSKKIKLENFVCIYYTRPDDWTYYEIQKNWHWIQWWHDKEWNPKKIAMENLIYAMIYDKKHNEMMKIYKKTNDYWLAWEILKKSETFEKIENEKNLLLTYNL
jgi:hypothetical protein